MPRKGTVQKKEVKDFKELDSKKSNQAKPKKGGYSVEIGGDPKRGNTKAANASRQYRGFNDPSWYAANSQLLKDAASLAFANFQGLPIHNTGKSGVKDFKPATLAALHYIPTFGTTKTPTDGMNIATRAVYSYVRHANSGHANYESADLGMYLFGVIELYGQIANLERAYGISRTYSVKNRAIPRQLLNCMNYDADDFLHNQANLRYGINRLIQKLGSLVIPKGFSLLERRIWMNSFVFKDADTDKSSLYYFDPWGWYKYNAKLSNKGGGLVLQNYPNLVRSTKATVADKIKDVEDCIDAILEDEDMNIMSGDILKAYGDGNVARLGQLPEDYSVVPVYQPEVLTQIHNLQVVCPVEHDVVSPVFPDATYDTNLGITGSATTGYTNNNIMLQQYDGILQFMLMGRDINDPKLTNSVPNSPSMGPHVATIDPNGGNQNYSLYPVGTVLFDLPMDDPQPADVMVGSRLTPCYTSSVETDVLNKDVDTLFIRAMGTEVVVAVNLLDTADQSLGNPIMGSVIPRATSPVGSQYAGTTSRLQLLEQFDMHPFIYLSDATGQGTNVTKTNDFTFEAIIGDLYNFTAITPETLVKLHTTAVMSEMSLASTLFANN